MASSNTIIACTIVQAHIRTRYIFNGTIGAIIVKKTTALRYTRTRNAFSVTRTWWTSRTNRNRTIHSRPAIKTRANRSFSRTIAYSIAIATRWTYRDRAAISYPLCITLALCPISTISMTGTNRCAETTAIIENRTIWPSPIGDTITHWNGGIVQTSSFPIARRNTRA